LTTHCTGKKPAVFSYGDSFITPSYFQEVKSRIEAYLESLTDETLEEIIHFNGFKVTRLELILAQHRHIMYHVGYLHCCLKIETGNAPEYIGLYKAQPEK
jgi:hypothetical protein